jgi:hypothetical protein
MKAFRIKKSNMVVTFLKSKNDNRFTLLVYLMEVFKIGQRAVKVR